MTLEAAMSAFGSPGLRPKPEVCENILHNFKKCSYFSQKVLYLITVMVVKLFQIGVGHGEVYS
jgi:hypothetical protein